MAWIEVRRKKDGSVTYWIRDRRGNRQIVILAGATNDEAERKLKQYLIRRDLEKEGYDDAWALVDEIIADNVPKKAP